MDEQRWILSVKHKIDSIYKSHLDLTLNEFINLLANSPSSINHAYSVLLNDNFISLKASVRKIMELETAFCKSIDHQRKALFKFSADDAARTAAKNAFVRKMQKFKKFHEDGVENFPSDSPMLAAFTQLHNSNKTRLQCLVDDIVSTPASIISLASMPAEQRKSFSFIGNGIQKIWQDLHNTLMSLTREAGMLATTHIYTLSPTKEHLNFLQRIISLTASSSLHDEKVLQSLFTEIEVLQKKEPEFADAYILLWSKLTDTSVPKTTIIKEAYEVMWHVCTKATSIWRELEQRLQIVGTESILSMTQALSQL
jgi:hypothetical protein